MNDMSRIAVVGASLAGLRAVEVHSATGTSRSESVSLDTDAREIRLEGGQHGFLRWDWSLQLAVTVRELPNQPRMDGIHTLRTLDDSLAIRAALETSLELPWIGAGFIWRGGSGVRPAVGGWKSP